MQNDMVGSVLVLAMVVTMLVAGYRIVRRGPSYFTLATAGIGLAICAALFLAGNSSPKSRATPITVTTKDGVKTIMPPSGLSDRAKESSQKLMVIALVGISSLAIGLIAGWGMRRRFGAYGAFPKVSDIEGFVSMLAAACGNASMQGTLERLLSLPDTRRREELDKLVAELRERRAPKDLIDAFICLQDDSIAERAYMVLYRCTRDGKPVATPGPA